MEVSVRAPKRNISSGKDAGVDSGESYIAKGPPCCPNRQQNFILLVVFFCFSDVSVTNDFAIVQCLFDARFFVSESKFRVLGDAGVDAGENHLIKMSW